MAALIAPLLLASAFAQKAAVPMAEFITAWKASKAYTLAVAEAMPPEGYGFKPAPDEFSFAAQMIHIAHANYAWFSGVMGEKRSIADLKSEDKARVVAYVRDTFDYCIGALGRISQDQLNQTAP